MKSTHIVNKIMHSYRCFVTHLATDPIFTRIKGVYNFMYNSLTDAAPGHPLFIIYGLYVIPSGWIGFKWLKACLEKRLISDFSKIARPSQTTKFSFSITRRIWRLLCNVRSPFMGSWLCMLLQTSSCYLLLMMYVTLKWWPLLAKWQSQEDIIENLLQILIFSNLKGNNYSNFKTILYKT